MRTLSCSPSPSPEVFLVGGSLMCLEGMGAISTSHFPLHSFRQWARPLRPEAPIFRPTPCQWTFLWLQRLQYFPGFCGPERETHVPKLIWLVNNMAARPRVCWGVTFLSPVLDFLILSSVSDKAQGPMLSVSCRMWGRQNTLPIFISFLSPHLHLCWPGKHRILSFP